MRYLRTTNLVVVLFLFAITGCDQGPEIVPVSGQVLIEGKPVSAGFIRVLPTNGRAAMATLGPDGRFVLKTKDKEGTYLGEHAVEISAFEFKNKQKIWYAPYRYADYQTSKLTAKVDGPTDNLQINLTWDNEANRVAGKVIENIQAE